MDQLEVEFRDLITKATGAKYISKLNIYEEDGFWTLEMGINCQDAKPIVVTFEGTKDQFKEYLCKDFKRRNLAEIQYVTGKKVEEKPYDFHPVITI